MTIRRVAVFATLLALALGACSSGSSGGDGAGSTRPSTTTRAPSAQELWVAKWRGTVAQDYAPAARRLQLALTAEQKLLHDIQQACTGQNAACQTAVTQYGDNNSKQVVPAFVALQL